MVMVNVIKLVLVDREEVVFEVVGGGLVGVDVTVTVTVLVRVDERELVVDVGLRVEVDDVVRLVEVRDDVVEVGRVDVVDVGRVDVVEVGRVDVGRVEEVGPVSCELRIVV